MKAKWLLALAGLLVTAMPSVASGSALSVAHVAASSSASDADSVPETAGVWSAEVSGTTADLRGVSFVEPAHGWAVGERSTIVGLQGHPTQQRNPWLQASGHPLARILPRSGVAFLASPRGIVDRVLRCHCGFEVRGAHEHTLVAEVRRHARDSHQMALSHEEALVLAFRAELDEAPTATLREPTTPTEREEP